MKTGCFKWYTGGKGVAICIRPPKTWNGNIYSPLAPPLDTFIAIKSGKILVEEYTEKYTKKVLNNIDPYKILDLFKDSVLLCWETPTFDSSKNIMNIGPHFCHRHILSKYICDQTGIVIKEWRVGDDDIKNKKLF